MPARLWSCYYLDPADALLTAFHGLHQAIVLREASCLCLPVVLACETERTSDYFVEGTPGQIAKLLFHLERLGVTGFTVDVDEPAEFDYFKDNVKVKDVDVVLSNQPEVVNSRGKKVRNKDARPPRDREKQPEKVEHVEEAVHDDQGLPTEGPAGDTPPV